MMIPKIESPLLIANFYLLLENYRAYYRYMV